MQPWLARRLVVVAASGFQLTSCETGLQLASGGMHAWTMHYGGRARGFRAQSRVPEPVGTGLVGRFPVLPRIRPNPGVRFTDRLAARFFCPAKWTGFGLGNPGPERGVLDSR
jgi:hypothetical protein